MNCLFPSTERPTLFVDVGGSFVANPTNPTISGANINDPNGLRFRGDELFSNNYHGVSIFFVPPVPEPSSFLLLGLGALGLVRITRRRKSHVAKSEGPSSFGTLGCRIGAALVAFVSLLMVSHEAGAVAISNSNYADIVLSQNPVAYWRLSETSGVTAVDTTSNGNDATYLNTPTLGAAGPVPPSHLGFGSGNLAPSLDGISDEGGERTLASLNASYSVSMWMRNDRPLSGTGSMAVTGYLLSRSDSVGGGSASTGDHFGIAGTTFPGGSNPSGALQVYNGAASSNNVAATIAIPDDNDWHHVALTRSGTTMTGYVDGTQVFTGTLAQTFTQTSNAIIRFGTRSDGFADLLGQVDEVAVFDGVLSNLDIAAQYQAGITLPPVPEPSSLVLLGLGALGMVRHTRRRRRRA